jgi:hypothetical protein
MAQVNQQMPPALLGKFVFQNSGMLTCAHLSYDAVLQTCFIVSYSCSVRFYPRLHVSHIIHQIHPVYVCKRHLRDQSISRRTASSTNMKHRYAGHVAVGCVSSIRSERSVPSEEFNKSNELELHGRKNGAVFTLWCRYQLSRRQKEVKRRETHYHCCMRYLALVPRSQ